MRHSRLYPPAAARPHRYLPPVPAALAPPVCSQERTRKRKAPTLRAADWEPYKERILDLHIEQDLPLPQVKQIMEDECGFKAELRQYRSCITRWGKDKNVKPQEMQAIVRKSQKRKLVETDKRELVFEVRGNEVDRQKIERWMKSHNVAGSFLYAPSPAASTPSAIECYTERGSPAPTTITAYSPIASAPSPDGAESTAESPRMHSNALSLTGILRSPTDYFSEHNSVPRSQYLPQLRLNFVYSQADSESVMDDGGQIFYRKDEEQHLRSELVIADLTILFDPWEVLRILRKLGNLLLDQMRYETAIDVLRSLVDGHRSRLGDRSDDLDMLDAIDLLGISLMFQRFHIEAERLFRREVQGRSMYTNSSGFALFGVRHLGWVLQRQNKLEEAELLLRQAMEETEKLYGPKDLSTLNTAWDLGSMLQAQGRDEEAEALLNNTLALLKELLRLKSGPTLCITRLLVKILISQERYTEAKEMQREVVALSMRAFGPEHLKTLGEIRVLGSISEGQGQHEEAETLYREILVLHKKLLGPGHLSTLRGINDLENVLGKQGRYKEVEIMHREELDLRKQRLGTKHPLTLISMDHLAFALYDQGGYIEAEAVCRETLALRKQVLGHEHPETLENMSSLGYVLGDQDRYEEAEAVHRETLALRKMVLGCEHPETLESLDYLRWVLGRQGRSEEAYYV